jgi:uncharacterized membrane protein
MSYNTFKTIQSITAAVIAAFAAASIVTGNAIILISVVIAGMVLLYVLRRRVKEIIADERTYTIAYKAARFTVAVVGVGMAVTGALLLALSHRDYSAPLSQAGFALEYATCGLLIVNYLAYYYYSRKLGGKNE